MFIGVYVLKKDNLDIGERTLSLDQYFYLT